MDARGCVITQRLAVPVFLVTDVGELLAPFGLGQDGRRSAEGQFLLVEGLDNATKKETSLDAS